MGSARLVVDIPEWVDSVIGSNRSFPTDETKMSLVIRLASENVNRRAGGPFAAAVFEHGSGRLVATGVNSVTRLHNCVMHAEVMSIMFAQQQMGSFTLRIPGRPAHELVTSCEPCAMCLGATLWSGVDRLVIGAGRDDAMAAGFDEGPISAESYAYLDKRGIAIVRDVMRPEAASVLEAYRRSGGAIYNPRPVLPAGD